MDLNEINKHIQHAISNPGDTALHLKDEVIREFNVLLENHESLKHFIEVSKEEISHIMKEGSNYTQHLLLIFNEVKAFVIKNQVALISIFFIYFVIVTIWRVW